MSEGPRAVRRASHGKPLKDGLLAIFKAPFLSKTRKFFTQTNNAPSMALLVLKNGKVLSKCMIVMNRPCRPEKNLTAYKSA